jgi:tyrosyl-tRNA synthetase
MTDFASPALRELAARGLIEQTTDVAALDAALAAGPVVFYAGFDPTGPSLHAGHLVPIMAMRWLQRFGHRPIVILGGGTARVGDPSGKSETRKLLSGDQIADNTRAIARQFAGLLQGTADNPVEVVDNHEWLGELKYIDFLREVGVHFTVNRMIATKTYRDRLDAEEPLSFIEFNYQLLQAYDFDRLYRAYDCTLQLGGSDQWGNMIAGVELIRRIGLGAAGPAQCLTFPLLTTSDGKKMGKTEKGAVWLDAAMCPPFDYYQFWIGCDDRDVRRLLCVYTDLPVDEIDALVAVEGAALRDVKAKLAFEATKLLHGEAAATAARDAAVQAFGGGDDWSAVPQVTIAAASIRLVDLVVDPAIAAFPSKRQARERIEGGGVKLDGAAIKEPDFEVRADAYADKTVRLQAGKKLRLRVVLGS